MRDTLKIGGLGVIGLIIGGIVGYLGYSYPLISDSPLIRLEDGSNKNSAFDQTYRGMARLAGLEAAAGTCDGEPVPLRIIDRENQVMDQIDLNSRKADLHPPLDVARAIAAHRAAQVAQAHGDTHAFTTAAGQEKSFLQAAGWKDTSPDHLASIVHDMDGCLTARTIGNGEKQ